MSEWLREHVREWRSVCVCDRERVRGEERRGWECQSNLASISTEYNIVLCESTRLINCTLQMQWMIELKSSVSDVSRGRPWMKVAHCSRPLGQYVEHYQTQHLSKKDKRKERQKMWKNFKRREKSQKELEKLGKITKKKRKKGKKDVLKKEKRRSREDENQVQ